MSAAEPYERLVALAEEELALVSRAELPTIQELDGLLTERDHLVASLPARPPTVAGPALARAAAINELTTAALARRVSEVHRSLRQIEQGRRTARGYGGSSRAGGFLDLAG
jgi:hypothetical protein